MQKPDARGLRSIGTWELDPARSKFDFDAPPKQATFVVTPQKGGLFFAADWVDPSDKKGHIEHTLIFDEPVLVNGTEVTLISVDDNTLDTKVTKDGAALADTRRKLSSDGKTMELVQSGTLPDDKAFKNVSTYVKRT